MEQEKVMQRKIVFYSTRLLFAILVSLTIIASRVTAGNMDLISYVQRQDSTFHWEKTGEQTNPFVSKVEFEMTSQTWHGIPWKHRVELYIPAINKHPDCAILVITGSSSFNSSLIQMLTANVNMPIAILCDIPNQPLFGDKKEDSLIAYTYNEALQTGDMTWPLLLPMTKSAVRSMDMLQAYSKSSMGKEIKGFVVMGASKRGWTTWMTAAADPIRVKGIVPIVYDNLNIAEQMKYQIEAYGTYSMEIGDYTALNLQERMNTDQGKKLLDLVDPWSYRKRITMPKLIINGTNDPYWTANSLNMYWDDLAGEKAVVYVPNAGHDLGFINDPIASASRVFSPVSAFAQSVADGKPLPEMSWKYSDSNGKYNLRINTSPDKAKARIWTATSTTLDFRNSKWENMPMETLRTGFRGSIKLPAKGYSAAYGESQFSNKGNEYSLCTQVRIFDSKGYVKSLQKARISGK